MWNWNLDDLVYLLFCETASVHQFVLEAYCFILMFHVLNNSITVVCKVSVLLCTEWFSKIDFTDCKIAVYLENWLHTLTCICRRNVITGTLTIWCICCPVNTSLCLELSIYFDAPSIFVHQTFSNSITVVGKWAFGALVNLCSPVN